MLAEKLAAAELACGGRLLVRLAPQVVDLPLEIQKFDDPFLPWTRAVVQATSDLVCGYVFDLPAYLALGAAGAVALERGLALVSADLTHVTILDGRFASADYVTMCLPTAFAPDAATVVTAALAEQFAHAGVPVLVAGGAAGEVAAGTLDPDCALAVIDGRCYEIIDASDSAVSRGWDFRESLAQFVRAARAGQA
jgi:hypothetical protein